jgi:hypothetical protein
MILPSPGMDRRITTSRCPHLLPWLVLLGRDELGVQFVQLAVRCFQLLIHQPDVEGQRTDMVARRLDHPGCD